MLTAWRGPRFENAVNVKRHDALALLEGLGPLREHAVDNGFRLAPTEAWVELCRREAELVGNYPSAPSWRVTPRPGALGKMR
jgi:hypothetical protein